MSGINGKPLWMQHWTLRFHKYDLKICQQLMNHRKTQLKIKYGGVSQYLVIKGHQLSGKFLKDRIP